MFCNDERKNIRYNKKNVFSYSIIYTYYDAEIQKLIDEGAEQWAIDDAIWAKDNATSIVF